MSRVSASSLGFQNIQREILEDVELEIKGHIPDWIHGRLFRNGPGILDIPIQGKSEIFTTNHWFDGLTVMHRFSIENSKVKYRNKKMAVELENYIATVGGRYFTFGADPCKTLFSKFQSLFQWGSENSGSNIGVTVNRLEGSRYFNKTDANILQEFNPETLEYKPTSSYGQFSPGIKGPLSAAHPQYDLKRKEYVNYTTEIGRTATYTFFAIPDVGETRIIESIPTKSPAYIHSFAMTDNYIILEVWPLFMSPLKMLWEKSIISSMWWDGAQPTLFYVIDRNTNKWIATFSSPPFFAFHNINAFEEKGNIVIDLSYHNDSKIVDQLTVKNLRTGITLPEGSVVRFFLDDIQSASKDNTRKTRSEVLRMGTLELPKINPRFHFKDYQFCYGISNLFALSEQPSSIVKLNVRTKEQKSWSSLNCLPAEPLFIPSPNGQEEDDGVLLSIVLDGEAKTSFLLVLDAKTLQEKGRAVVPQIVPFGFHGNFFGEKGIEDSYYG